MWTFVDCHNLECIVDQGASLIDCGAWLHHGEKSKVEQVGSKFLNGFHVIVPQHNCSDDLNTFD